MEKKDKLKILAAGDIHGDSRLSEKLAEKANLAFNTITKIEQGLAEHPNLKTLIKLADVLGVGLDELVGRK